MFLNSRCHTNKLPLIVFYLKNFSGSNAAAFAAAAQVQSQQLHDMKLQNINDKADLARLMAEIGQQPAQINDIETGLVFKDDIYK